MSSADELGTRKRRVFWHFWNAFSRRSIPTIVRTRVILYPSERGGRHRMLPSVSRRENTLQYSVNGISSVCAGKSKKSHHENPRRTLLQRIRFAYISHLALSLLANGLFRSTPPMCELLVPTCKRFFSNLVLVACLMPEREF